MQFGLPQQVLSRLVTEAAMSDAGKQLNIGLSDDELGRQIEADPNFKNANGAFDKNRMIQLIAANGMNEQSYVDAARSLAKRRQLIEGLVGGLEAPTVMVKDFDLYMNQERTVRYLDVPPRAIKPVGEPTEDQLKAFYEAHKAQFRAPEYRSATFVVLDPATLADPSKVSDADAQAAYDRDSGSYGTPETRAVQQIPFPDKAAADAALAKLKGGGTLDQVLADRKLTEKDIDLGTVAKTGLVDPKIADAVFALPVNEFAEVDGRFGPVIVRVTAIEPAARKPFDSVKADIKQSIAAEKAKRDLLTTYDSIEDARAAGSTLKEIAAKNKLPLTEVAGIDSTARPRPVRRPTCPVQRRPLGGVHRRGRWRPRPGEARQRRLRVARRHRRQAGPRPAARRVKPEVAGAWKSDETQKALAAKADEVAAAIRKGETIDRRRPGARHRREDVHRLQAQHHRRGPDAPGDRRRLLRPAGHGRDRAVGRRRPQRARRRERHRSDLLRRWAADRAAQGEAHPVARQHPARRICGRDAEGVGREDQSGRLAADRGAESGILIGCDRRTSSEGRMRN